MSDQPVIDLPEQAKTFTAEIVRRARSSGIGELSGSFFFDWVCADRKENVPSWREKVSFSWKQGRHGSTSEIKLHSQFIRHISETFTVEKETTNDGQD